MDTLPLELICRIIDLLSDAEPNEARQTKSRQADLALISKRWRDVVEDRIFSTIKIKSTELETFADMYRGRLGTQRRAYLHKLELIVIPPEHDDAASKAKSRIERVARRKRNNEAFTTALKTLFTTLSSWPYDVKRDRSIDFEILDPPNVHLREKIKLVAPDAIPQVQRITSFKSQDTMIRIGSLPLIACRLPRLREINWESFDHSEPLNSIRRRRDRYEFAKNLHLLANSPIQQANLTIRTYASDNEDIETPSLLLPGSTNDEFSQSLHDFSQLQNLSILDIHDAVITPTLFWPSETNTILPFWPNLRILRISINRMAADGGWYFEQNPHVAPDSEDEDRSPINSNFESMPPTPERVFSEEELRARNTNLSASSPISSTDSEAEEQKAMTCDTTRWFRTWPSSKMEDLLHSIARALTRMPRLKYLAAGTDIPHPGMSVAFEFFYLSSGEQQDLGDPEFECDDIAKPRLFWRVPKFWRMSREVETVWRDILGRDGVIEYQEWDN